MTVAVAQMTDLYQNRQLCPLVGVRREAVVPLNPEWDSASPVRRFPFDPRSPTIEEPVPQ